MNLMFLHQFQLIHLKKMNVRITGVSDWFEDLDAKLTITPSHISMKERALSLIAF